MGRVDVEVNLDAINRPHLWVYAEEYWGVVLEWGNGGSDGVWVLAVSDLPLPPDGTLRRRLVMAATRWCSL
jgi:hypothetical protein